MGGQETRVTKISKIHERLGVPNECCLVEIHGPNLGKKYVLDCDEFSIGRDVKNDLVVDLDNVSRRHARIVIRDGKCFVEDLGSTNGTYLNDEEVLSETALRSGDLVKVGSSIFKFLAGEAIESLYHEEIYRLTISDGLTQISNKRYFLEFLEREMGRCHRYGRPLSLLMFDVDHFKLINDENGHLAGDYVLKEIAQVVRQRVRKEECFARYGGEEFALVMPESGADKARVFAEKIRKMIEGHAFVFEERKMQITISLGVADMVPEMTETAHFIKVADANLYRAKKSGRNCVV